MGQGIPEDNFFAELLEKDGQNRISNSRENIIDAHFSYPQEVILLRNSHGLDRDEVSHVRSGSDICKPTGGKYPV